MKNNNNLSITIIDAIKNIVSSTENEVKYDVNPHTETKGFFNPKAISKVTVINITITEPI